MSQNIWKNFNENKNDIGNGLCIICNGLSSKPCSAPCGCRFCSDCIEHYLDGNDKFCPGTSSDCQKKMLNFENDIIVDNSTNQISEIFVNCRRKNSQFTDEFGMIGLRIPNQQFGCEINAMMNERTKEHSNENNCCHSKLFTDIITDLRNEIQSMKREISEINKQLYNVKLQSIYQQQHICELVTKEETNASEIEELNQELMEVKDCKSLLKRKHEKNETGQDVGMSETNLLQQIRQIGELNPSYQWQQEESKEIESQEADLDSCYDLNTRLDKQDKASKQAIDRKSNILPMKTIETEKKLKNEKIFCDFKWKIQNLSQWRGIQIFSKPFYSGKPGYKMCLSVYIDLSTIDVHFHLMCSKFDDNIVWPFQYPVTIDVINQENENVFKSKTRKFSGRNNVAERKKPSNERNDGICFIVVPINSPAVRNNQIIINCKVNK